MRQRGRPGAAASSSPGYFPALVASLALETGFVAAQARRLGGPVVTAPNLLTLSRGLAASLLCGAAFSDRGLGSAWPALILGCTVADWLDGPLARRRGPTPLGRLLDVEADSWLTLWASIAAYRRRRLGGFVLVAPAIRYPLGLLGGRPLRPWQRAAGVAQMVVLCASLAPWAPARSLSRTLAPAAAAAQLLALVSGRGRGDYRVRVGEGLRVDDAHLAHGLPLAHHRRRA
ncbi:CDP-alcohol phosphatidyltransferase family protein [Candidatus Nephthysia bennettiae]|uniref:CDP-alcohol phosphatidyltransferase family protein n=1 Tax=Candidatus Nephthysia bennettiae TaxID=3127016 RepID=A0A934K7Q4_9BACT|nr:CDP-alcohol phosphatidyltransferase family protein [Candidatus Dormibacteraeota bacterium]MBJ7613034.1 CDP-alcohol phosphatidyltransferase family protein [Candidatus Dormibacteraeota bacterium]